MPRRRLTPKRLISFTVLFLFASSVWYINLPPDSPIRLAVIFNTSRLNNAIRDAAESRDAWLWQPARYPVDLRRDVGYLIKTGYGTRHRLPEQLEAFAQSGDILGQHENVVVVGDWTAVNETDAELLGAEVHDAIQMFRDTKIQNSLRDHSRFAKYETLQEAIKSGDEDEALKLGQKFGWELDALKFIMGMDLLREKVPNKKWYVILDDDTFLVAPSLDLFLSHLDPREPHYLGNAVGDYKGRFAHGGSGIVLSGEAMQRMFLQPSIVTGSYLASLDETWGDKLVATTLQKLGVYLDERYAHHFNGESPEMAFVTPDRFCSPILSFHGLRTPDAMRAVGKKLSIISKPVLWGQLFGMFGGSSIKDPSGTPRQDHVGPRSKKTRTWEHVKTAEACLGKCEANSGACMAWTHDAGTQECHTSPWMLMGTGADEGTTSGIHWENVKRLQKRCP